ncbi:regulator of microtubule dynamics protein 2 isoform X2 [Halyomorpha halys]|uniref:regulator of microtubule dynamics protein 2 isoform X2 n=1 Tax=Halyomorpha halys TaxID=286706 RepID=UPI0034D1AD0E
MNGNLLRSQGLLAIAVGAGVVIGAAGVFLYEHLFKEKRRLVLQKDVTKLGISISELRKELQELRDSQKRLRRNRIKSVTYATTDLESETQSVVEDIEDDEFYDLSDDNDDDDDDDKDDKKDTVGFNQEAFDIVSQLYTPHVEYYDIDIALLLGSEDDKKFCLGKLEELCNKDSENPDILWRIACCYHSLSIMKELQNDLEQKKKYIDIGLEYAKKSLELAPESAETHKWYAIFIGAQSETQSVQKKLKASFEFKKHVEEALRIQPNDPLLLYLLGRFFYEVAILSWLERKVATTLFGEIPYATFPEAIESLKKGEKLCPYPWKENKLMIAKCYVQMGKYGEAMYWLDKADEVETITKEVTREF